MSTAFILIVGLLILVAVSYSSANRYAVPDPEEEQGDLR